MPLFPRDGMARLVRETPKFLAPRVQFREKLEDMKFQSGGKVLVPES